MKNYSDLIKSKQERTLTAKGNSFVWKCIDIVAEQNGLNRYSKDLKPLKEKLKSILYHLMIDKELSLFCIKELIKQRKINNVKIES